MATSKVTVIFSGHPVAGDTINIGVRDQNNLTHAFNMDMTWEDPDPRVKIYDIPTRTDNPPSLEIGETSAIQFEYWFNNDRNATGLFVITRTDADVEIAIVEGTGIDWEFYNCTSTASEISFNVQNITSQTFQFSNDPIADFDEASASPCSNVEISIQTTELATRIDHNGVTLTTNNTNNPWTWDMPRGVPSLFALYNAGGDRLVYPEITTFTVGLLSPENVSVDVQPGMSGATVTFTVEEVDNLTLEYSLDGTNWFTDNFFTGQENGTGKVVYIRDQYGCMISYNYDVTAYGSRAPYLFISKANSFTFIEQVDWDGCSVFKNDENALAHQNFVDFPYCEELLVQTCDTNTLQIKSNYETVTLKLRKDDLSEVTIPTIQRSANLNRFKSMDAWYYPYSSTQMGIYFMSGDTYDEFGAPITDGEFALNGNVPEFAIKGGEIQVKGAINKIFEIKDVTYDENIGKNVIIVDHEYVGSPVEVVVASVYDLLPYEIYEFVIDWSTYGAGTYDLLLENTDTVNGSVFHLTENILCAIEHANAVSIRYYNENNRDIFYLYGIEHHIRIPVLNVIPIPKDDTEINITDDDSDVVKSVIHEANDFDFGAVTSETMRKLTIALSCEHVFIQDIGYVKEGKVRSDNIENTNLHYVSATMLKTGVNYRTNRTGIDEVFDDLGFDIPTIITTGTAFIKK